MAHCRSAAFPRKRRAAAGMAASAGARTTFFAMAAPGLATTPFFKYPEFHGGLSSLSDTSLSSSKPDVAWIAGVGPSAGLGAALGRRFAKEGYVAVLTGRNAERVNAVSAEIVRSGGRARGLAGDVSSPTDVGRLVADIGALGPLRVAVFNAGN